MSVALPIEEDPRFRRYTASAGQKVFSIPFPFQQAEDVVICLVVDDLYTEIGRSLFEISGAMAPDGGSVTFAVGRSAGEVIAIIGSAVLERLSSIVRDGRFSSKLTDDELDRNRIIQQEQQRDIGRALKAPYGGKGGSILATSPSTLLHLDTEGNIRASETPVNEKTLREEADLALASLLGQAGPIEVPLYDTCLAVTFAQIKPTINAIHTGGYSAAGDGGDALYKRVSSEPSHDGKVQSADGAWWEMVGFYAALPNALPRPYLKKVREQISVFDALPISLADSIGQHEDTSSEYLEVTAAISTIVDDLSIRGGRLFIPRGLYMMSTVFPKSNVHMVGEGRGISILRTAPGIDNMILYNPYSTAIEIENVSLSGITFDGNGSGILAARSAVDLSFVNGFTAKDCDFVNATGYGLGLQAKGYGLIGQQKDVFIENCRFYNNGSGVPGGETYDGIDIKDADRLIMIGCLAWDNYDKGIDVRGRDMTLIGNVTYDNGVYGLGIGVEKTGDPRPGNIVVIGHHAHSNGNDGVVVYGGPASGPRMNLDMIGLSSHENAGHGLNLNAIDNSRIGITGGRLWSNSGSGINSIGFEQFCIANTQISSNQRFGIEAASGVINMVGGSLNGNTLGHVNNPARLSAENVRSYQSINSVRVQAAIDISSTGVKTFSIPHGLSFTPGINKCSLTLCRDDSGYVQDFSIGWMWVASVSSTDIVVQVNVSSASATAGAKAGINLDISR
ncbi:right-handed parallel beta-helix repeat-containing protein [Ochrobactrum sp. A-1]|uniref:right-handed parallel beta-helix repeat-containing protein n=1 Tax=Ochrobactrum sp. A-1 TaxID=2920940 RepID=UPI001F0B231B|nr:right-handed parallel beta-helix repeat-containing protein [Ochrobactrum sp. A-1]